MKPFTPFSLPLLLILVAVGGWLARPAQAAERPHIVLVMADDMGWAQTEYYGHPILKTPNLNAMAENGLRLDRFYAGAPNCSPTRSTVMTGRSNDRTGVENHGYAMHLEEKTVARALRDAGYATGHFGKWHLDGLRGPGAPILASDEHSPGAFGFDTWLSVTNFFDLNPLMSRQGEIEEFEGDSSEIIVDEALKFIRAKVEAGQPSFTVIWYGSPHSPFRAVDADKEDFGALDKESQDHHGELVAMDRSIGTLRQGLRDLGIAENTLLWFNSDNGGLPKITPSSVGELRGFKNSIYEGGLRVPAIIEWPAAITQPRITSYPAGTVDIFPTLADVLDLPDSALLQPLDGMSLEPLFEKEIGPRKKPLPFRHTNRAALVDNDYKILTQDITKGEKATFELYNLTDDPSESKDLSKEKPELADKLKQQLLTWSASADASLAGKDLPSGSADPAESAPRTWMEEPAYQPYLDAWKDRPEFARWLSDKKKGNKKE